jgi:hypothetical protein
VTNQLRHRSGGPRIAPAIPVRRAPHTPSWGVQQLVTTMLYGPLLTPSLILVTWSCLSVRECIRKLPCRGRLLAALAAL